jgi:undecaprenyl pyrophosphate synthase
LKPVADTRTAKQRNRQIRQEALREQLAAQKHIEKVVDNIEKIEDAETELFSLDEASEEGGKDAITLAVAKLSDKVPRLKTGAELRMKLVNKYLPDLKAQEISFDPDQKEISITYVTPDEDSPDPATA